MTGTPKNITHSEDGFVLPYVLVVIFILALASTIAVRSINASSQIITTLNNAILAEQRMISAEADTLYVFLTSAPVKGGVDTSYTLWNGEELMDGFDVSRLEENAIWPASGGRRTTTYPSGSVAVVYRDVSGLVPVNRNADELLVRLFRGVGLKSNDAKSMAAKFGDYVDGNTRRRFRGAERGDYRLKRLPPPANTPLRVHEEMYRILGWDDLISPEIYNQLRDYTTLTTSTTYYRTRFLSSEVLKILGLEKQNGAVRRFKRQNTDIIDDISSSIETPTLQGRFIISTPIATGQTLVRVVELERSPGAPDRPFRRHVVFEETRNVGDTNSQYTQGEIAIPIFSTPHSSAE